MDIDLLSEPGTDVFGILVFIFHHFYSIHIFWGSWYAGCSELSRTAGLLVLLASFMEYYHTDMLTWFPPTSKKTIRLLNAPAGTFFLLFISSMHTLFQSFSTAECLWWERWKQQTAVRQTHRRETGGSITFSTYIYLWFFIDGL